MNDANDSQTWLSINDAAQHLGVHPRTLRRYIRDGKLNAMRLSHQIVRIRPTDMDTFLKQNVKVLTGTGTCYVPMPERPASPVEDYHGKAVSHAN